LFRVTELQISRILSVFLATDDQTPSTIAVRDQESWPE
jgi:hypothetical protein